MASAMTVTLELPEEISSSLAGRWGDVPRHILETTAVEGYRTGALSEAQVMRLLRLSNRFEVHALLKRHRVALDYSISDLEDDLAAHRDAGLLPAR